MGGLGSSGKRTRTRKFVDTCWELDANHLLPRGCLEPGQFSTCPLVLGNGGVVALNLRAEVGRLYLSWCSPFSCRDDGGSSDGGSSEIIPFVRVPCRFGGSRPYFVCPGITAAGCGRRMIKLYLSRQQPGCRRFLCRHC